MTFTEPTAITPSITVDSTVSCNGGIDGGATASATGGTAPYTYIWSNAATTANITGVVAGTYTVTITDDNSCTTTASIEVSDPTPVVAEAGENQNNCSNFDTRFGATGSGGTSTYTYLWSTGAITEDISGLTAGTYSVTVTDANGCEETASFTIEEAQDLVIDVEATVTTDVECNGDATGEIDLVVTGGTPAYTYLWSNGETTEDISSLTAGTYTVTVTDANGCEETASFTIEEATDLVVDLDATVETDVACFGEATGAIDLVVTGGTPAYTYLWSNGQTLATATGLGAPGECPEFLPPP